jgi:hypothetical protein
MRDPSNPSIDALCQTNSGRLAFPATQLDPAYRDVRHPIDRSDQRVQISSCGRSEAEEVEYGGTAAFADE